MYDLNSNERQDFGPVPPGLYRLKAKLKPGGVGENALLRLAKNMRTQMLDIELTVIGGTYDGRKIFELVTVFADLGNSPELAPIDERQVENYKRAVNIGLTKLRDMLESAHEISHDDDSAEAQQIRRFKTLRIFDGLEYWVQIDIKEGTNGYKDRNVVDRVITPDMHEWPGEALQRPPLAKQMNDEIPF